VKIYEYIDSTLWYTVSLVGLGGLIVFMPLLRIAFRKIRMYLRNWGSLVLTLFKKHLYYPAITHSWDLTRYGVLLYVILFMGNIFPIIYGNSTFSVGVDSISKYSVYMCVIKLSPLILWARLNPLRNVGLSSDSHHWIHVGFGLLEAAIHSAAKLKPNSNPCGLPECPHGLK